MIPNNSNTTNGCDSTSSNCVVWQGPNLTCVDVCTGDTISDIIAKLCESIVGTVNEATGVNIDTINQLCLETTYGQANTIQELTQNIITELCTHNSIEADVCSCIIPLPDCLQYQDEQGNTVTTLPLYDSTTGTGYATYLANTLCDNIGAITILETTVRTLDSRVRTLESYGRGTTYVPPKVIPAYVGAVGLPTSVSRMLIQTEEAYGQTRRALGTVQDLNKAIGYAQNNLAASTKLNGSGTMSSTPGWITSPRNLAQSFQNLWITANDMRNAVESIQDTVANPLCSSLTYGVTGNIRRERGGAFKSIELDFISTDIPTTYVACNGNGTKVTITDASLNFKVYYINVAGQYQNSPTPYTIASSQVGNLDTGSNLQVKVEFCFQSADNQCAETQIFTIKNETACPELTLGTITSDTIPWTVSNIVLPSGKNYVVTVNLKTKGGSIIDSRSTSSLTGTFTGTFTNLSTIAPACTSSTLIPSSTNWVSTLTSLQTGANTLDLGTRYDGTNKLYWTAGFDSTNLPIIIAGSIADTTTAKALVPTGSNVNNQNPTTPILCDGTIIAVAGGVTTASTKGSGWRYINSLMSPNSQMYYVFAEVNIDTNSVTRVVFCCDCSQLSLNIPKAAYTVARSGGSVTIPITAVGDSSGSTYTWTVTTDASNGIVTLATTPAQTSNTCTYIYTATTVSSYDSFSVTLTNGCGTSTVLTIPIINTFTLAHTDTDITVMVDTLSVTLVDATAIKNSFEEIKLLLRSTCASWTGTFNYVAVNTTSRSGDYMKHVLGMVEEIGNASALAHPAITMPSGVDTWYTQFMESGTTTPSYWRSGATAAYPSSVFIISFVNTTNSSGSYGAATLGSVPTGWQSPTQPTTNGGSGASQYREDYDSLIDITSGLAPTSAWGIDASGAKNGFWIAGSIPFTFSQIIINKITGSTNVTAAAALQMASALTGPTDLTNQQFDGMKIGGPVYPVDLSTYLKNGVSPTANPYNTSITTTAGNTLSGLQNAFSINAFLFLENGVDWNNATNPLMTDYMLSIFGQSENQSTNCPIASPALRIGGTTALFGNGGSKAAACSNASASSPQIWSPGATVVNTTPAAPFAGAVLTSRAYTKQSAATNGQSEYELTNNQFYAIYLASGTEYNAKYHTTAQAGGVYWTLVTTC